MPSHAWQAGDFVDALLPGAERVCVLGVAVVLTATG
jgi:hypothetical protein